MIAQMQAVWCHRISNHVLLSSLEPPVHLNLLFLKILLFLIKMVKINVRVAPVLLAREPQLMEKNGKWSNTVSSSLANQELKASNGASALRATIARPTPQ